MTTDPDELERMVFGPPPKEHAVKIKPMSHEHLERLKHDCCMALIEQVMGAPSGPADVFPQYRDPLTTDYLLGARTGDKTATGIMMAARIKAENDWILEQLRARRTPWQRFMDRFDAMASFEAAMLPVLVALLVEVWELLPFNVFCLLVVVASPTILRAFQRAWRGWKA